MSAQLSERVVRVLDGSRLQLAFPPTREMVERVRRIPGCRYEQETGTWTIHVGIAMARLGVIELVASEGFDADAAALAALRMEKPR